MQAEKRIILLKRNTAQAFPNIVLVSPDDSHTDMMVRFRITLGMAPGTVFVLTYELDFGSGTRQVAAIRSDLPDGDGFDSLLSVIPNGTIMTLVPPPEKHLGDNPKKRRRSGGRTHQTNEDDILCSQLKQFIGMTGTNHEHRKKYEGIWDAKATRLMEGSGSTSERAVGALIKDRHLSDCVLGSQFLRKNGVTVRCPLSGCILTTSNFWGLESTLKQHFASDGAHKSQKDAEKRQLILERLDFYTHHQVPLLLTKGDVDTATSDFQGSYLPNTRNLYVPTANMLSRVVERVPELAAVLVYLASKDVPVLREKPADPMQAQREAAAAEAAAAEKERADHASQLAAEVKADEEAQRLALASAARATDAGEVAVRALRERARKNVAQILSDRMSGNDIEFRVKWLNQEESSWESSKVIGSSPVYAAYVAQRAVRSG